MWGSKPSQQWENFFGIIVPQLWVTYPVGMGFDFIVIVPFQPSYCGFLSLDMRFPFFFFFFGKFQHPLVNSCSPVSCDFGVLARGHEHTSF